jgi:hypothetical protein
VKRLILLLSITAFGLGAVVPAVSSDTEDCDCSFAVTNPHHLQELGGRSGHQSHGGLHRAAEQSPVIDHEHSTDH